MKIRLQFLLTLIVILIGSTQVRGQSKADSVFDKTQEALLSLLQKQHDTTYIQDLRYELAVKVLGVFKYTSFAIKDRNSGTRINYRPDRQVNLGFGVAYKWFAIDLAFNVGLTEDSEQDSEFFNFNGKVFSRKQYIEVNYQYYYGYKIAKVRSSSSQASSFDARQDIRTINISLSNLYSFNYGKFSIQAPFILNEVQKKSAGSFLSGVIFNQYTMGADSSIVPSSLEQEFSDEIELKEITVGSVGVRLGYMYSIIYRKLFFTLGLIPSLNLNYGDYIVTYRSAPKTQISVGYTTMNAFGYNGRRFFTGFQFTLTSNFIGLDKKGTFTYDYGNAKYFVGYRFKGKDKKGK